jgi:hypothetical protein
VQYAGPSRPTWYSAEDFRRLLAAAPEGVTVADVVTEVFDEDCTDRRLARALTEREAEELHQYLCKTASPVAGGIGSLGRDVMGEGYYHKIEGTAALGGAVIPYCVELSVGCGHLDRAQPADEEGSYPTINRGISLAPLYYGADSAGLSVRGCGLTIVVPGAKRARYSIDLSLIAPFVRLMNDGKTPFLGDFAPAIRTALEKTAVKAYRAMIRPPSEMNIKDAAFAVMADAYHAASDDGNGGTLPAKARQIMYQARGKILELTGAKKFSDTYFTQVLLPDYMAQNPEETAAWDVVYDARGHLNEPHTGRSVPLGTIQVRQYLGERGPLGPAVTVSGHTLYPTCGPKNRYQNVLFIEKEGFDELFEAVALAERYDIAIMSTKGMSVVAARSLLDRIAGEVDRVFALTDFDVSGFSICGTLGTDSRRYVFDNAVNVVPIGLRLDDIEALGLEPELVKVDNVEARQRRLAEHGATDEEIEYLADPDENGMCRRVELNAMSSRQLVDFVEQKLLEYGCAKVVPADKVVTEHARRMLEAQLTAKLVEENQEAIAKQAAEIQLPDDLVEQVSERVSEQPQLSWDGALAEISREWCSGSGLTK